MKKTKVMSAKRSFFMSVVSLVLCFAMLLGTTYAWFTDEVTSGRNKIVAGNLDVELKHYNKNTPTPTDVKDATGLFDNIRWEPGAVVYENFVVSNVGTLALKYALNLNVFDKNTLTTAGVAHDLSEVIKVAVYDGALTATDRESLLATEGLTFGTLADFQKTGALAAKNETAIDSKTFSVVLYWEPTDNDNLWNVNNGATVDALHDGKNELFIEFGVNLVATQNTVESDSFDNKYDKMAEFPVTAAAKVEAGKVTKLTAYDGNNTLAAKAEIPADDTATEGADKIEMVITETDKPATVSITDNQKTLNLDVKFFSVKDSGEKTPITQFSNIVNVDLSAVLPDGAIVASVYHTHNGESKPMQNAESAAAVTDGQFFFDPATRTLTIGSKTFSPFTLVYSLPDYGFHKSYQAEDGHWIHEITNPEQFRNIMDSTVHDDKTGIFGYPGAGKKETVYLIMNDIDFGGSIYSEAQIEEVKTNYFTGTLKGNGMVTLSNVHLTAVMGTAMSGDDAIWGLFDRVVNAKFENLTLSDFAMNNAAGKVCGFLAAGYANKDLATDVKAENAAVAVKNVTVADNCSMKVQANAGTLFGNLRDMSDIRVENCINNANVTGSSNNIGGFIGSASYSNSHSQASCGTMVVSNCTNNGKITGAAYLSSFTGYQYYNAAYTNYTNNGDVITTGNDTKVGIAMGAYSSADIQYNNVVNNAHIYYSTGATPNLNVKENKSSDTQVWFTNSNGNLVSGFAATDDYKQCVYIKADVKVLTLGFDGNLNLTVSGDEGLNVSKVTVSVEIGKHTANPDGYVPNSTATGNYQVGYFTFDSMTAMKDYGFKKINQLGYFSPAGVEPLFPEPEYRRSLQYCLNDYKLGGELYGTTGYTDSDIGYGVNSKGGYVLVRNVADSGFTVLTPIHESPKFRVTAYDASGNIVAVGTITSGYAAGETVPTDIHLTAGIDKYVYIPES